MGAQAAHFAPPKAFARSYIQMTSRPKVALLGLGLMGSSLAHALRTYKLASHIAGYAPSAKTRNIAKQLGMLDSVHTTPQACVAGAQLVFLNAPVGALGDLASSIAGVLAPEAIVTDVGSVKRAVINQLRRSLGPHMAYVPAHPIAGTEQTGPAAGFATLFQNRWCVLTPTKSTPPKAVQTIRQLWQDMGARVAIMSPAQHDTILALTSHLPHLVAYGLVGMADHSPLPHKKIVDYSAGGFRDFTRIAASNPVMWRDIFLANAPAVSQQLRRYIKELTKLARMIDKADGLALETYFATARHWRKALVRAGQETSQPDFGRTAIAGRAKSGRRTR